MAGAAQYGALAGIYDALVGDAALAQIIAAFESARTHHQIHFGTLADIGCGTGRFLEYLTRYPAVLYGVDRSPEMLQIAQRRLHENTNVHLIRQDMRTLALPHAVDCMSVNFATVNYLTQDGELEAALSAMAQSLVPGGWLVFDFIPAAPSHEPPRSMIRRFRFGSTDSVWRTEIDPHLNRSIVSITVQPSATAGRNRTTEVHRQRWFHPQEVSRAVGRAGLTAVALSPLPRGPLSHWWQTVAVRPARGGRKADAASSRTIRRIRVLPDSGRSLRSDSPRGRHRSDAGAALRRA
jgi:SAM-dependent methyltransferase